MVKLIPFPSACIIHTLSLAFLPIGVIPFAIKFEWPILWLPIGVIAFLWLCDLMTFLLSLSVWWNVPLRINAEGISLKNNQIYLWKDAISVSLKKGPHSIYGPLYSLISITYSDGSMVSFEKSERIIETIRAICSNENFLLKLNQLMI